MAKIKLDREIPSQEMSHQDWARWEDGEWLAWAKAKDPAALFLLELKHSLWFVTDRNNGILQEIAALKGELEAIHLELYEQKLVTIKKAANTKAVTLKVGEEPVAGCFYMRKAPSCEHCGLLPGVRKTERRKMYFDGGTWWCPSCAEAL